MSALRAVFYKPHTARNHIGADLVYQLSMGLQEDFDAAAKVASDELPDSIPNDDKLQLYALFKQATVGDCNTSKPGIFDQKGRYKWDAWNAKKGMSQDEAKEAYIKLVNDLKEKHKK